MAVFRKIDDLITEGYCDSRRAAVCATIVSLPNWKSKLGIALLCVKDNFLSFYEVDLRNNIGDRVGYVELAKVENFILKANFLIQRLSFEYEGEYYEFTNFGNHKILKQVFAQECKK